MPIPFVKFHGYGNDYLVIQEAEFRSEANLGAFAERLCNRHYVAGADGIAVVGPADSAEAHFRARIFHPDGSEASLSGNGTRCAVACLYYQQLWTASELRLTTRSGIKHYLLRERVSAGKYLFDSDLGAPRFDSASIPMLTERPLERVIDYPLPVNGATFKVTALQMGNPNCCIFVDDFGPLDWPRLGRTIEIHPQFPDRTNVEFARIINRQQIELRIWERGVGETTASGTCSCAAAIAAMVTGQTERQISVVTPGGEVAVHWREDDRVVLTGTAELVYSGQWLVSDQ